VAEALAVSEELPAPLKTVCRVAGVSWAEWLTVIATTLLIGGDKTGNDRFYEQYVPRADDLYDDHIKELRVEGLI